MIGRSRRENISYEDEGRQPHNPGQPRSSAGLSANSQKNKEQHDDARIPFYDDPNHLAYGWQQMAALPSFPSLRSLARGDGDDLALSCRDGPQTWPVDQPPNPAMKIASSGFNPHPKLRRGPRRPPPLIIPDDSNDQESNNHSAFRPFTEPTSTSEEIPGGELDHSGSRSVRLVLASKDANQKLHTSLSQQSGSSILKQTEAQHETPDRMKRVRPRKKLVVDELESVEQPKRGLERMPSLAEEPAPLRTRKNRIDEMYLDPCRRSAMHQWTPSLLAGIDSHAIPVANAGDAESKPAWSSDTLKKGEGVTVTIHEVTETKDDEVKNLIITITQRLSAFSVTSRGGFERQSAVPKPLDLERIKAGNAKRELARSGGFFSSDVKGAELENFYESGESFATDAASRFASLGTRGSSAPMNTTRKKWPKDFRRFE